MKTRHVPVRTCVACRATDEKRDLLRIVRLPDGITTAYDARGKASGRGAYVCASEACIAMAQKQKRLEKSLKVSRISCELFEELRAVILGSQLPGPTSMEKHG